MFQVHVDLENLQSFGVLNSRGFERLLEKLNSVNPKPHYKIFDLIQSKLSTAHFSNPAKLLFDLSCLQDSITNVSNSLSGNLVLSKRSILMDRFFSHSSIQMSQIYTAIKENRDVCLETSFHDSLAVYCQEESATRDLLTFLIHLSIIYGSASSLKSLMKLQQTFMIGDDFITYCVFPTITYIITLLGRRKFFEDNCDRVPGFDCVPVAREQIHQNNGSILLKEVLEEFHPDSQIWICTSENSTGRTLMYRVAEYGLLDVYEILLEYVQHADDLHRSMFSQSFLLEDFFGNSPLSIILLSGFEELFNRFLKFLEPYRSLHPLDWKRSSGTALVNSIRSTEINQRSLRELLETGPDINLQKKSGQTALYITASCGNLELVELLLGFLPAVNKPENIKGWTPLIIASIEGHATIVKLLLEAGADKEHKDHQGWTASDHAAYRGHMAICKILGQRTTYCEPYSLPSKLPYRNQLCTELSKSRNENVILVNIGSFNSNERIVPVEIFPYDLIDDSKSGLGAGFSIRASLVGTNEQRYTLDLPILADLSNRPWSFHTDDIEKARLKFDIYRLSHITEKKIKVNEHIGSAVAILANLQKCLGPKRESLIREYQIPILSKESLDNIGTVTFSLLVVKPFKQDELQLPDRGYFWKDSKRTKIVGHRGKNHICLKETCAYYFRVW